MLQNDRVLPSCLYRRRVDLNRDLDDRLTSNRVGNCTSFFRKLRHWRILVLRFIETSIFTRQIDQLLDEEEYRGLQLALATSPRSGDVVPGGAGLRKLRWPVAGSGKRGGLRILYYWNATEGIVYLLFTYRKSRRTDLTRRQLRDLARLIRQELG